METRHFKDITVAVIVIVLFAFLLKSVSVVRTTEEVPSQSIHRDMAIDQDLLAQIQQIEESISDRKEFLFTVTRDPLEQNLIVRTRVDLEQEWRKKVEEMIRLAATYIDEHGNKKAAIAYQGKTNVYTVGDYIEQNRIAEIETGRITLVHQGIEQVLELKPIPPKPAQIDDRARRTQEYIW
jgi:translation elongation factor EF-Ts